MYQSHAGYLRRVVSHRKTYKTSQGQGLHVWIVSAQFFSLRNTFALMILQRVSAKGKGNGGLRNDHTGRAFEHHAYPRKQRKSAFLNSTLYSCECAADVFFLWTCPFILLLSSLFSFLLLPP